MHPNSLNNLTKGVATRWQPGHPGNPQGVSLLQLLQRKLDGPLIAPPSDASARELLVYAMLKDAVAVNGSVAQRQDIWDRIEGRVPQTVDTTIHGSLAIVPAAEIAAIVLTAHTALLAGPDTEQGIPPPSITENPALTLSEKADTPPKVPFSEWAPEAHAKLEGQQGAPIKGKEGKGKS